jgi:hypothetical protein
MWPRALPAHLRSLGLQILRRHNASSKLTPASLTALTRTSGPSSTCVLAVDRPLTTTSRSATSSSFCELLISSAKLTSASAPSTSCRTARSVCASSST